MRVTAVDAMLTHIYQVIPRQILEVAYEDTEYDTSLDQRINEKLLIPVIHKDVSILCGKTKTITLNSRNRRSVGDPAFGGMFGMGMESEYYVIDPSQREGRDIAFVVGPTKRMGQPYFGGDVISTDGGLSTGNTMMNTAQFMLNSRTLSREGVTPVFNIAGSNTIRVTPGLLSSYFLIDVLLGYDYEYSNAEPSVIMALQQLAPIAAKRDIYTRLVVNIDQGAVIAGSEIGVIHDIVADYASAENDYRDALIQVQRAGMFDADRLIQAIIARL